MRSFKILNFNLYLKPFGQTFIKDDEFLAIVGSVSQIFNALGRPFWGFVIDRVSYKVSLKKLKKSIHILFKVNKKTKKLCFLTANTLLVALTGTFYLTEIMAFKGVYLIWICLFYFFTCANFIIQPIVAARCFGQKNFVAIQSVSSVITVIYMFKKKSI